ncbi:uncharacterized protein PV09_09711 [Verruconis gallopava]|uniref:Uncharacterized protein n=1 Tax=Verruconis gallopava TaxID=253628 RepID=A0A0D1X8W4_9PEZI|nr:uncharacterized protein PV09_09711 [Verruconis gallopava]KIV98475.1 hypothetical protein PV09_09711 [Verruconis gallopava]
MGSGRRLSYSGREWCRSTGRISLVCRERSPESLQRFSSPPISATTPDSTTNDNEPLCREIDAWIEPPLKAPTPSSQDDVHERADQYIFQYMAPLGHMPPIRLLRELKDQELA